MHEYEGFSLFICLDYTKPILLMGAIFTGYSYRRKGAIDSATGLASEIRIVIDTRVVGLISNCLNPVEILNFSTRCSCVIIIFYCKHTIRKCCRFIKNKPHIILSPSSISLKPKECNKPMTDLQDQSYCN